MQAILLVWGVPEDALKKIPVKGSPLYGEYDFIAKVEFKNEAEMERFETSLRALIKGNTYKLLPILTSSPP
ncbi:MAG: hypothetical protein J7K48_02575 [Thermococcus sp.]|nr:hypothetical protein [Thermococcus sp.]